MRRRAETVSQGRSTGQQLVDALICPRAALALLLSLFCIWQYQKPCIAYDRPPRQWDKAGVQDGSRGGNGGGSLQDTVLLTHRTCCNEPAGPERRNEQRQGSNQGGKASTNAARRK